MYQELRAQFDCWAFVSVSQTPDTRKLLKDILSELGRDISDETLDVRHFIDAIGKFLEKKRYERIKYTIYQFVYEFECCFLMLIYTIDLNVFHLSNPA